MRAETKKALQNNRCIEELDSLICDIRKFNGTCTEKELHREDVVPKQVSKQIDRVGWFRSAMLALSGVLHTN